MLKLRQSLDSFFSDEDGQSITEYGAVIAFVGVLIALVFSMSNGTLFSALSQSFSSVTSNMSDLNAYVSH